MSLVLCTGSRRFRDDLVAARAILARLDLLPAGTEIVQGGCGGADRYVKAFCDGDLQIPCRTVEAKWRLHEGCRCKDRSPGSTCKFAGIRRNLEMLDLGPDMVIAFWNGEKSSKGTRHCIDEARRRGIPTEVLTPA